MNSSPLVSIILTVYKRTEYLIIALESALAQTLPEFEIIIADDSGSKLAEPIYELYQKDSRIIYQPNRKTIGVVNSIKSAINISRGEFISILNDDDFWNPTFLAKLVAPLVIESNIVLTFSDHWIIDDTGKIDAQATDVNTVFYKRHNLSAGILASPTKTVLLDNGIPLAMASVFRKDALPMEMLMTDVSGAYDFWISCLLAATGKPFFYVNERLTNYRVHSQMETGRRSIDKQFNNIYIYETLLKLNLFPKYLHHLKEKLSFSLYKSGMDNLYFKQRNDARNYFKKALKIKTDYRPMIAWVISYLPNKIVAKLRLSTL